MKSLDYAPVLRDSEIVLVFDVETNGLLNTKKGMPPLKECPYVLQLSYVMYDLTYHRIVKTVDAYVRVADHVIISEEITRINGISKVTCDTVGVLMETILKQFYMDYHQSHHCVAHNYSFDSKMIHVEFQRHWPTLYKEYPYALNLFLRTYMEHQKRDGVCTMMTSTALCQLPHTRPPMQGKTQSFKWPTLTELHKHLFGDDPTGMHNSMMDVLVTLRCYLAMERKGIMSSDMLQTLAENALLEK
jgi:DNA polymerase III epsilon subunit-like protein